MKNWKFSLNLMMLSMWLPLVALADSAGVPVMVPSPLPSPGPSLPELAKMAFDAAGAFKSAGWQVGMCAVITLIIASMKNTVAATYFWDKLKWGKAFIAPLLALIMVEIMAIPAGQVFSLKSLMVAAVTGAGAIALHELMDGIKEIPGIGPLWISAIDFIGKFLGSPKAASAVASNNPEPPKAA